MAQDADTQDSNGRYDPRNKLNELTGKEWIKKTKSYRYQKGLGKDHPEAKYEKQHPAPFSFTDIAEFISFFTKSCQKVLDPFSGVGSTIKAAHSLGREGYGVELIAKWIDLTKKRLAEESDYVIDNDHLILGDSRNLNQYFTPSFFDFIITSPPYWNILDKIDHKAEKRQNKGFSTKYSEHNADIGNIVNYEEFLDVLVEIFEQCHDLLRPKGHMVIIVGDFRHNSKLIPFHSHIINRLTSSESPTDFVLKGVKIILQRSKSLYPYGYPYSYVENIHHQYAIILRRG